MKLISALLIVSLVVGIGYAAEFPSAYEASNTAREVRHQTGDYYNKMNLVINAINKASQKGDTFVTLDVSEWDDHTLREVEQVLENKGYDILLRSNPISG